MLGFLFFFFSISFFTFKKYFYAYECFVCMYVCVLCIVPIERTERASDALELVRSQTWDKWQRYLFNMWKWLLDPGSLSHSYLLQGMYGMHTPCPNLLFPSPSESCSLWIFPDVFPPNYVLPFISNKPFSSSYLEAIMSFSFLFYFYQNQNYR